MRKRQVVGRKIVDILQVPVYLPTGGAIFDLKSLTLDNGDRIVLHPACDADEADPEWFVEGKILKPSERFLAECLFRGINLTRSP